MNLNEYLSESQIREIKNTIIKACNDYRHYDKQFMSLFYEPYTIMRKKHFITSAVLSAFSPEKCNINGFTSKDIYYGIKNKLSQPELKSKNIILQIYSNGSDLKCRPILENSKKYNSDISTMPIFMVIVFSVDEFGYLNSIIIKLPNSLGTFVEQETIFDSQHSKS